MSLKPICVPCRRFFRLRHTGYIFTEGMPTGRWGGPGPTPPGKDYDEYWKPYKLWQGDMWYCQGCGAEIISGVGFQPVAIQHMDHFEDTRKAGFDQLQVNDC